MYAKGLTAYLLHLDPSLAALGVLNLVDGNQLVVPKRLY